MITTKIALSRKTANLNAELTKFTVHAELDAKHHALIQNQSALQDAQKAASVHQDLSTTATPSAFQRPSAISAKVTKSTQHVALDVKHLAIKETQSAQEFARKAAFAKVDT